MAFSTFAAPYTRKEFPDQFDTHTFGPFNAANLNNIRVPLFVLDRDCDIESITLRWATSGSNHEITIYKAASGTALGSGTGIGSGNTTGLTPNTPYSLGPLSEHQNLAAGTLIGIGGGSGLATLAGLVLTVRTKNRRSLQSDGNQKVWRGD